MTAHVSPFDNKYLRLGRAAELIAQVRGQTSAEDVMDLFKRALFAGEFDAPPFEVGETRNAPDNWLHMEIEAPRSTLSPGQAALTVRPKELYGVNRGTVASVLLTTDALPGRRAGWEPLFDLAAPGPNECDGLSALAAIPFRDFPARGRKELEAIVIPKAKLALWLRQRGSAPPALLAGPDEEAQGVDAALGPRLLNAPASSRGSRSAGRPQKPSWPRVLELVRQLASEHPDWLKKRLAFEGWIRAREEFSESELPSVTTILRRMAEILNGGAR